MLLEAFKNLFDNKQTSELSVDDHSVVMAAGALMLEIARSDHDISEDEKDLILRSVKGLLGEAETQIAGIFDRISEEVEESVSLYDFTSIINENFSNAEKYSLLVVLWKVAFADGRLDKYEEYYIRKIKDLIHLSQSDFIKAKHEADSSF